MKRIIFIVCMTMIIRMSGAQTIVSTAVDTLHLPQPYHTESVVNYSKVLGWSGNEKPIAPAGFEVSKFADNFHNPRWIYIAPNGDVFISEAGTILEDEDDDDEDDTADRTKSSESQNYGSANRIILFRDVNNNNQYEARHTYMTGLNQPLGMLALNNYFYVANTDGLMRYPYDPQATSNTATGTKLVSLPAGGYNNHWTRNIITNPQNDKILISVGSASNNAEYGLDEEYRRATILEVNPDGTGEEFYATGLRNPVGMDWCPVTGQLWTVVNERDELGDDLVPDYATHVQRGGFYGWPFAYYGPIEDPRMKGMRPDLVAKTIVPDIALGSHTSTLGITFYDKTQFPSRYHNGIFLAQHGSWNRAELLGYRVLFVPFENGKPSGPPEDFLTGFIKDRSTSEVYGRPVCVAVLPDGSLLVSDDAARTIWRVTAK